MINLHIVSARNEAGNPDVELQLVVDAARSNASLAVICCI